MQKIINFIKYHNAVPVILAVVLLATAGAFASEDVRNTVLGEKIISQEGIDNSQILIADLENFDFALQITAVSQDENNHYINYTYNTLAIQNNIWQKVSKGGNLTVSKVHLGSEDLGLYVQEEVSEVADYEIRYLRDVQLMERKKGVTELTASVDYTGLIGLVLDAKNKIFPAYEPVVQPQELPAVITYYSTSTTQNSEVGLPAVVITPGVDAAVCQNGANRSCGSEVGVCRIGVQVCEQGQWGACMGAVMPAEEMLDKVDNNCDGQIDEGL